MGPHHVSTFPLGRDNVFLGTVSYPFCSTDGLELHEQYGLLPRPFAACKPGTQLGSGYRFGMSKRDIHVPRNLGGIPHSSPIYRLT